MKIGSYRVTKTIDDDFNGVHQEAGSVHSASWRTLVMMSNKYPDSIEIVDCPADLRSQLPVAVQTTFVDADKKFCTERDAAERKVAEAEKKKRKERDKKAKSKKTAAKLKKKPAPKPAPKVEPVKEPEKVEPPEETAGPEKEG